MNEFQGWIRERMAVDPEVDGRRCFLISRFAEEAGELVKALNRAEMSGPHGFAPPLARHLEESILDEAGDVLAMLAIVLSERGLYLEDALLVVRRKLGARYALRTKQDQAVTP